MSSKNDQNNNNNNNNNSTHSPASNQQSQQQNTNNNNNQSYASHVQSQSQNNTQNPIRPTTNISMPQYNSNRFDLTSQPLNCAYSNHNINNNYNTNTNNNNNANHNKNSKQNRKKNNYEKNETKQEKEERHKSNRDKAKIMDQKVLEIVSTWKTKPNYDDQLAIKCDKTGTWFELRFLAKTKIGMRWGNGNSDELWDQLGRFIPGIYKYIPWIVDDWFTGKGHYYNVKFKWTLDMHTIIQTGITSIEDLYYGVKQFKLECNNFTNDGYLDFTRVFGNFNPAFQYRTSFITNEHKYIITNCSVSADFARTRKEEHDYTQIKIKQKLTKLFPQQQSRAHRKGNWRDPKKKVTKAIALIMSTEMDLDYMNQNYGFIGGRSIRWHHDDPTHYIKKKKEREEEEKKSAAQKLKELSEVKLITSVKMDLHKLFGLDKELFTEKITTKDVINIINKKYHRFQDPNQRNHLIKYGFEDPQLLNWAFNDPKPCDESRKKDIEEKKYAPKQLIIDIEDNDQLMQEQKDDTKSEDENMNETKDPLSNPQIDNGVTLLGFIHNQQKRKSPTKTQTAVLGQARKQLLEYFDCNSDMTNILMNWNSTPDIDRLIALESCPPLIRKRIKLHIEAPASSYPSYTLTTHYKPYTTERKRKRAAMSGDTDDEDINQQPNKKAKQTINNNNQNNNDNGFNDTNTEPVTTDNNQTKAAN